MLVRSVTTPFFSTAESGKTLPSKGEACFYTVQHPEKPFAYFKIYLIKSYLGAAFPKNALSIDKALCLKRDGQKARSMLI